MPADWKTIVVGPLGFLIVQFLRVLFSVIIGVLVSLLLVRWSMHAARAHSVLARPGHRMSHTVPTPRLGGLGMAGAVCLMLAVMHAWMNVHPSPWLTALFFGGGLAFAGGMLDDILDLAPPWKALFQVAAAGSVAVAGVWPAGLTLGPWAAQALGPSGAAMADTALGMLFAFCVVMFVMNAVNFMDGLDGQAAVFGVVLASGMFLPWYVARPFTPGPEIFVLAALTGGLLGLYWYNSPGRPADDKTFMGDCGSQFTGFVLALMMLRARQVNVDLLPMPTLGILLLPFAWDVVYTLIRRASRRENLFEAHRSHLYQRLLVAGWTHGQTLALNTFVCLVCLLLAMAYPTGMRDGGVYGGLLVCLGAVAVMALYTLVVLMVEKQAAADAPGNDGPGQTRA